MHTKLRKLFTNGKCKHLFLPLREGDAWEAKKIPWYLEAPMFSSEDLELLRWLRRELSHELGLTEINDCDVMYFALQELSRSLSSPDREDKLLKLLFHISQAEEI